MANITSFSCINPNAAGIDIGSRSHYVAPEFATIF